MKLKNFITLYQLRALCHLGSSCQRRLASRQAIRTAIVVLIAIVVEWRYAASQESWIVISALLVSQTTRGTPFKQGLYFFVLIVLGVVAGTLMTYMVPSIFLLQVMCSAIFIGAGLLTFYYRPLQDVSYFTMVLLPLVLIITIMFPVDSLNILSNRLLDVLIGACLGMVGAQLIFPARPYQDMVSGLSSLLKALSRYSDALAAYFSDTTTGVDKERAAIKHALQVSGGTYPEWIYEAGFNPGLRAGYRFFLVGMERVSEVFFSMDALIAAGVKKHIAADARKLIAEVSLVNSQLVEALKSKLEGQAIKNDAANLTSDVDALEELVSSRMPAGLDVLGFNQEYAQVAILVRDLKDVRQLLLQLLLSVPA